MRYWIEVNGFWVGCDWPEEALELTRLIRARWLPVPIAYSPARPGASAP